MWFLNAKYSLSFLDAIDDDGDHSAGSGDDVADRSNAVVSHADLLGLRFRLITVLLFLKKQVKTSTSFVGRLLQRG